MRIAIGELDRIPFHLTLLRHKLYRPYQVAVVGVQRRKKWDKETFLAWVAHGELKRIWYSHSASRAALQLLATNEELRSLVQVQFQINNRFEKQGEPSAYETAAERVMEIAHELSENDFQLLRRSSLVGICSAFEHLVKSLIVEWAELEPDKVNGLDTIRLSVQASDFLESDLRDRLFLVADRIYLDTSTNRGHLEKVRLIVGNHLPQQTRRFESKMQEVPKNDFNQAFLVRNCIVHHGACVNRQLSRQPGFELGNPVEISAAMLGRYFSAIQKAGDALADCSFLANVL